MRRIHSSIVAVVAPLLLLLSLPGRAEAIPLPASCTSFTDATLTPGVTVLKAVHIMELRTCVGALRAQQGLSAYPWTDAGSLSGVIVKALHLLELRVALAQVYQSISAAVPTYSSTPAVGVVIRAVEVSESGWRRWPTSGRRLRPPELPLEPVHG
jgi:hypothetical protein